MPNYHILKTYFHGTDEQWLKDRFEFFMNYTYPCLQKQTFRQFMIWFCCSENIAKLVRESPLRRCMNGVFTFGAHYPTVLGEVSKKRLEASDFVYVTRLDSDDLYAPDALHLIDIMEHDNKPQALMYQRGYLHDVHTGRWGIYYKHSSPFHCLIFPTATFVDEEEYKKVFVGDHGQVTNKLPYKVMPEYKICVLTHGKNSDSNFDSLCKQEFTKEEIETKQLSLENFYEGNLYALEAT